jgi:hypothetical protein
MHCIAVAGVVQRAAFIHTHCAADGQVGASSDVPRQVNTTTSCTRAHIFTIKWGASDSCIAFLLGCFSFTCCLAPTTEGVAVF